MCTIIWIYFGWQYSNCILSYGCVRHGMVGKFLPYEYITTLKRKTYFRWLFRLGMIALWVILLCHKLLFIYSSTLVLDHHNKNDNKQQGSEQIIVCFIVTIQMSNVVLISGQTCDWPFCHHKSCILIVIIYFSIIKWFINTFCFN